MKLKRFFYLLISLSLFVQCKQSEPLPTNYKLVWSDDFNGSELNQNKWEYMTGDGTQQGIPGWGNNEEQYYRKENVSVSDGILKIKSISENFDDKEYTSARIRSLNRGDFKYGKIEASIRMSNAGGLWHAFWMLPSNPSENWPISGEIDIMEFVGNRSSEIFNTIHFANQFGGHMQLGKTEPILYDNLFHKYTIEWDANKIVWFMDNQETFKVLRTNTNISSTWPFDSEFHLLLNTAVGGNLGGNVSTNTMQTAQFMEVDYVKVYQKK